MRDRKWCIKTLKRISYKEAPGSGRTEDFQWGMVRGWYAAKLITRRIYNELIDQILSEDGI